MELGVARSIKTIELLSIRTGMDDLINDWIHVNPSKNVIDIQYRGKSALIIYRV